MSSKTILQSKNKKIDLFRKLRDMKILLIDDDRWIRDSLTLFFEGEGCQLLALETAEDALDVLKNQEYDIIIADYRLPGIDGLEFFRRIQDAQSQPMKIFITAYKDERIVSEATKIGIQDFIEKPFTSSVIEQALSWIIKRHEHKGNQAISSIHNNTAKEY